MRSPFRSIAGQIMALMIGTFCLSAAVFIGVAYWFLTSKEFIFINEPNRLHIAELQRSLAIRSDGTVALNLPADLNRFYSRRFGNIVYRISDENRHTLFESDHNTDDIPREERNANLPYMFKSPFLSMPNKVQLIGMICPVQVGRRTLWIQVAKPANRTDHFAASVIREYFTKLSWFILPIFVAALFACYLIVRRMLRPVREASASAAAINPARLDVRLPTENLPYEVKPLASAVNLALERVERGYRIQREFSADAAHELRTPLSVLRMRLYDLEGGATADRLKQDVDAMTRVVSQLLDFAEMEERDVLVSDRVDLRHVCKSVIEAHAPAAVAMGKDIALTGSSGPVLVRGNAAVLYQAVRNLVENALVHTPTDTTVTVHVDPRATISVSDKGPGILPEDREFIFRRFWRKDRSHTKGAGLGLAIVAKAMELHGGAVAIATNPEGGACFLLNFENCRLDG